MVRTHVWCPRCGFRVALAGMFDSPSAKPVRANARGGSAAAAAAAAAQAPPPSTASGAAPGPAPVGEDLQPLLATMTSEEGVDY